MINPFAKSERVRRRAAQWFARMQGPVTEQDREALAAWLARDPSHHAAFDRLAGHWRAAAAVAPARLADEARPDRPGHRLAWAAALALALAGGSALVMNLAPPFVSAGKAQALTVETATGEIRALALADGSRLTLDTQSRATVRIDRRQRLIRIDRGRARLAYTEDERPLRIAATDTILVEGAGTIDVARVREKVLLRPLRVPAHIVIGHVRHKLDERSALSVPAGPSEPAAAKLLLADPDWPAGVLTFDDEPLVSALARANRYSTTPILLDDPALARERLTGRYRAGDSAGLAKSLAAAFDLELSSTSAGAYRLRPGGNRVDK